MVCGAILGTLVGGQSTIGNAQLAFSFGLSAWWFTIGAALGALLLGLLYAGPLRRSGCTTLMEVMLSQNNYRVLNPVEGSSQSTYVFGFGGAPRSRSRTML